MDNTEFKAKLTEFKYYLKPALFTVLAENADIFSAETKKEIVDKLEEADKQMQELSEYQEKRNNILKRGLDKIDEVFTNVKARFKLAAAEEQSVDAAQADKLISNM